MIEFRSLCLEDDRVFVLEMFLGRAFESAPDPKRRAGLNQYRREWLEAPATAALMQSLEASLQDARTIAEVVVVDGTEAGFVWATFAADPGEPVHAQLRLVAFRLDYQRRGLGRLSVQHVEELVARSGVETLRSTGSAPSDGVRRFHESLGFEPVQTVFEKRLPRSVK